MAEYSQSNQTRTDGRLFLTRPKAWFDRLRKYKVWVDDELVGKLAQNEQMRVPVTAGPHFVRARIDYQSAVSPNIVVGVGENVEVLIQPAARGWIVLLGIVYALIPGLWLSIDVRRPDTTAQIES